MADTPPDRPSRPGGADGARYLVTARKYRPQTFADLVAQEHVADTLRNAITSGRLAHAYLFSGPRGVGKTTAARILAKAVNCRTPLAERPGAEPCRTCDSCLAFEEGRSLNVIEIDAASNNRVEDIRELRDTVRIPPQGATKKVYILDEVHMLSASAFNALLKTLEEPPPYVLFIFATTEPHKVLPTILSRTQRFDFRRISVPEIVARLREICQQEGVEADDEALVLIARKGDGALRDALSLFDQALALCGPQLDGASLREALGVVPTDLFFETTDRAQAGDRAGLLGLVDGLVGRGYDLPEFVLGLADHVRNLLVARATGTADLIEGTDAARERYLDAATGFAETDLLHLLMLADESAEALRDSRQPRLTLELTLLKMASLQRAADLSRLIGQIETLEQAVAQGTLQAATAPPAASSSPDAPRPAAPVTAAPTAAVAPAAPPPSPSAAPPVAPTPPHESGPVARPALASEAPATYTPSAAPPRPDPPVAPPLEAAPRAEPPRPAPPPSGPAMRESAPPDARRMSGPPPDPRDDERWDDDGSGSEPTVPPTRPTPVPAAPPTAPPAPRGTTADTLFGTPALRRPSGGDGQPGPSAHLAVAAAAPVADPHFGPSLGRVREAWPALVEACRDTHGIRLASVLRAGRPLRVARGAVEVNLADAFACRVARAAEADVAAVLTGLLGADAPPLVYVAEPEAAGETVAPTDPFEALKTLRQEHPVVRALFERFGAEIVYQ